MLPSGQKYLKMGGMSAGAAAYTTIGCFLSGVVIIQIVARFLHRFIPSGIIDCEHNHEDEESGHDGEMQEEISHTNNGLLKQQQSETSEATPLLSRPETAFSETTLSNPTARASPLLQSGSVSCDGEGPCYGYSNPCAQECSRGFCRKSAKASTDSTKSKYFRHPSMLRSSTAPFPGAFQSTKTIDEDSVPHQAESITRSKNSTQINQGVPREARQTPENTPSNVKGNLAEQDDEEHFYKSTHSRSGSPNIPGEPNHHHHHIAKNAFLAIGLQTSIAIAVHKLPEGFITYATNHANPKLGFLVFMALFVHNITEGYAMALPLYLALESRWKSMFWSSLLGGISQPLGAGIAALWFQIAGKTDMAPGETVYGCMFAITGGIMSSVALQLFSESIDLAHNNGNLCIAFAFVGMGIMGLGFALTAS